MNLAEVIQEQWADDGTLNGLLASTRVMVDTYYAEVPVFPYATLEVQGGDHGMKHNDGSAVRTVVVVVSIFHEKSSYDECKAIAEAVQAAFNRAGFNLSGSDKVLDVLVSTPAETQDPETGEWTFTVSLTCMVYLSAGV